MPKYRVRLVHADYVHNMDLGEYEADSHAHARVMAMDDHGMSGCENMQSFNLDDPSREGKGITWN